MIKITKKDGGKITSADGTQCITFFKKGTLLFCTPHKNKHWYNVAPTCEINHTFDDGSSVHTVIDVIHRSVVD